MGLLKTTKALLRLFIALPGVVLPGISSALEDCSSYVEEIDQKIAAAEAAGQDAQLAVELRSQIPEMCAFLDEASLRTMVDGLDQILPYLSDMAAPVEQPPALPLPLQAGGAEQDVVAGVAGPTGRSPGGGLVARADAMHHFGIWDMDLHQGRARVTYHTRPDRLQAARDDWEFVSYVVEVDRSGHVSQRLIDRRQSSAQGALALRRGTDEVVMQWQRGFGAGEPALERYSISSGMLLSRERAPRPPWPDSDRLRGDPFLSVTGSGTLFYIGTRPAPGNATEHTLAWFEASPEGVVLSEGSLTRSEGLGASAALDSQHGAATIVVNALGGNGIDTQITTPIRRQIGDRVLQASVAMEKRLLVVHGSEFWESPALERMLLWDGDLAVPQDLGAEEMLRQSQAQMAMMAEAELEFSAGRTVNSLDVGLKRVEMVKPLQPDRYVALVTQVADRRLNPPRHGQYLLSVTRQTVDTLAYLEPLAEREGVKFTALTVSPSADSIYLLAVARDGGDKRVYRLRADGQIEGFARTQAGAKITLEGLVADDRGVWAFGRGTPDNVIGDRLWTERLEFSLD